MCDAQGRPPGIETQAHVESVVAPLGQMVRSRDNDCAAFVIACYSDPGLLPRVNSPPSRCWASPNAGS